MTDERGDRQEALGSPPIEPMPDVSWARIERGLWSRLDGATTTVDVKAARTRTWVWMAAPLVAAAAVTTVAIAVRDPAPAARVAAAEPTRVVTESAPSSISLGDAHITLDAHSAITTSQTNGAPTVLLERGAGWFSIAPRGERPPFMVVAGDAQVQVIGTRFRVARDGERSEVTVDHGIVEVRYHGAVTRLTANQSWSSDEVAIELDPTPGPHRSAPVRNRATTSQVPATQVPQLDPDAARFETLTKLEASQPDVAMKGYLELSQGSGKWAEVALFAAARLAVDRHDARAETLLSIYLRRFASGANVTDAENLLTRFKGAHP